MWGDMLNKQMWGTRDVVFSKRRIDMPEKENNALTHILDLFSVEQLSVIVWAVIILVALIILIGIVVLLKNVRHIIKFKLGIFEAEFDSSVNKPAVAYRIAILNHPMSVSGNPAVLNTIKVRVYDRDEIPLRNKRVKITIEGHENDTEDFICGSLTEITDDGGYAVFSDLQLVRRGSFSMVFHVDNVIARAKPFDVTPPGLDTNFMAKAFGSDEYTDTLRLAISLSKGGDQVTLNGEDIR